MNVRIVFVVFLFFCCGSVVFGQQQPQAGEMNYEGDSFQDANRSRTRMSEGLFPRLNYERGHLQDANRSRTRMSERLFPRLNYDRGYLRDANRPLTYLERLFPSRSTYNVGSGTNASREDRRKKIVLILELQKQQLELQQLQLKIFMLQFPSTEDKTSSSK